jgi:ankyrin repeat protein
VEGDYYEQAILQLAVESDHNAILVLLLDKGANIGTRRVKRKSLTALYVATFTENYLAVQVLLKRGADVNDTDKRGWPSLMQAAMRGNEDS